MRHSAPRRGAPDQYHAFTARLAAAGYQNTAMRVVAGCILALGLPALLAAVEPRSAPWPGFRLTYLAIAACCVAMALPWLRYRWPTRGESAAVVVVGSVALAVGCLVTIDPLAGLVIASSFSFVLGYTALFHGTRLLAFAIAVAAVTVALLAVRIAAGNPMAALAVTVPIVLLGVVVTFACRTVAVVGSGELAGVEVDPVTGLLTPESFYERAAALLGARHRDDDRYLVVAVLDVDGLTALTSLQGGRGTNAARVAVGQALRETTRHDAVVGHRPGPEFVIADTATAADPSPFIERVRGAVAATPSGITASIGVVSTPLGPLSDRPPHDVLDELITVATGAMARARGAGGNQVRYVLDPDLTGRDGPASR